MSKIDDFRAKYPGVYDDLSDAEIAEGLYRKSYSDMPRKEFDQAMGLQGSEFNQYVQPMDDAMRIAADSMGMGIPDKVLGPEDRAFTEASRDRLGGTGTAIDIGAGMINPFKLASKTAATAFGAGAGALDAYGHQENWIPDWEGVKDIGIGGAVGGATGFAGAKGGEMIGGLLDRANYKKAKAGEKFKSSGDLETEATRRQNMGYEKFAEDYRARAGRVKQVEAAQGKSTGEFGTMLKGMDLSPAERTAADAASKAPGMLKRGVTKAGELVDQFTPNKKLLTTAGMIESMFYGLPVKTAAAAAGAKAVSAAGKKFSKPSPQEVENLLSVMRDPSGKGYRIDSVGADVGRDLLAKFGIGAGKQANR